MDDSDGSIAHEPDQNGHFPGLCPVFLMIYRVKGPEWVITWHHRHEMAVDPAPFGILRQIFN